MLCFFAICRIYFITSLQCRSCQEYNVLTTGQFTLFYFDFYLLRYWLWMYCFDKKNCNSSSSYYLRHVDVIVASITFSVTVDLFHTLLCSCILFYHCGSVFRCSAMLKSCFWYIIHHGPVRFRFSCVCNLPMKIFHYETCETLTDAALKI